MQNIEKLPLTSMDITEEQLQKFKLLFPEVFTEGLKVDWKKLKLTLGESIDIGKERIRRVSSKIKAEIKAAQSKQAGEIAFEDPSKNKSQQSLDLGFKVFKLDHSNFKIWDSTLEKDPEVLQQRLFNHIDHISHEAAQESILYELLLKSGYELTTPIEKRSLADKMVFSIAGGQLLICLEKELNNEVLKAMAELQPVRVICLDQAFTGINADALKTNAVQIMKSKGVVNFRTV